MLLNSKWAPVSRSAAVGLALLLCAGTAGCDDQPTKTVSGTGCPDAVTDKLDPDATATTDLRVLIDPTGSFDRSGPGFRTQFHALAQAAVDNNARLTVTVLGGTSSGVETVLTCPTVVPKVRNEAARARLTGQLVDQLDADLWDGFEKADQWDKKGSDIVGGFRAVADTPVASGTKLVVLAWTDGMQTVDDRGVQVSLPGATVLMFGIGHTIGGNRSTQETERLVKDWTTRLRATGADPVRVSLTSYTGGLA